MRLHRVTAAAAFMAGFLGAAASFGADMDDPYLWLEDTHGAKPLEWVKEKNAVSLKQLKGDPSYQTNYDALLAILDADDRHQDFVRDALVQVHVLGELAGDVALQGFDLGMVGVDAAVRAHLEHRVLVYGRKTVVFG